MKPIEEKPSSHIMLAGVALTIAILSIGISLANLKRPRDGQNTSQERALGSLERVKKSGVIRVGWGGFPPYTRMKANESDPNRRVEGFMVDVVNEIASRSKPQLKVEWHLFQWETFRPDLLSGKFDFIADPVYWTVDRALDFRLCEPVSYFGIAVALVRADETRFSNFADLDRSDITIALAEGYTSTEYARSHLSKPHFKSVPIGQDAFSQLDEVLFGRADVALNDVPTVAQYARAHAGRVKFLWVDNPPAVVLGGFLTRKQDSDLADFLNASIRVLRADGTLKKFDERWKTFGMFPTETSWPGAGLKAQN
jgi:ABC-type amino acid transport substrate-binding protein